MTRDILLRGATLFDGTGSNTRDNTTIWIRGGRIHAVEGGEIPAPAGAEVHDLAGDFVLPGLIDTHVHATLIGDDALSLFLAAGVTSVRDVGGALDHVLRLREATASGALLGPRLFVCGPLLDGSVTSLEHPDFAPMLRSVPSVEAVPGTVSELLAAGVDGVKLYFSLTPDVSTAIIRAVDGRVPVTGHLGYTHSLDAIEAGIDGLEHVWISPYNEFCALDMQFGVGASMMDPTFWTRTLKGWEDADLGSPSATTWFDAMVEHQVHMGTTLDLLWTARCGVEKALEDPDLLLTPAPLRARQRASAEAMGERPDWMIHSWFFEASAGAAALEKHQEVTKLLFERGGRVVGGTDCGAIPYPPPGFSLLREIELLAEAIGTAAALQSVTSVAARYLRQEREIGSVTPGCRADLLVVEGDPLRDVRELRNLRCVYRDGVAHDPAALADAQRRAS